MDLIPDAFSGYDAQNLQQVIIAILIYQLCNTLDPFETGYVSWRKYLAIQARIFPISSATALFKLKEEFHKCPSYQNGKVRNFINDHRSHLMTIIQLSCGSSLI